MTLDGNILIVVQVIWELRSEHGGQRVALCHTEVQRRAQKIQQHLSETSSPPDRARPFIEGSSCIDFSLGSPPRGKKLIKRQNWYNNKVSPEWKAIRRAIDGDEPMPGQEWVEKAIDSFGTNASAKKIAQLRTALDEACNTINDQKMEFEQFKRKTYNDQFVAGRFMADYELYRINYESLATQVSKEEVLRKQLDIDNTRLRKENKELLRLMAADTNISCFGKAPGKAKIFLPDYSSINCAGSDTELMDEYRTRKTEAFEKMTRLAGQAPPDEIFLIFHMFNIDVQNFVQSELPCIEGRLTYVFACYEPISQKRNSYYMESVSRCSLPPRVFLVIGDPPPSNVVPITTVLDIDERLRKRAKATVFRPYNLDDELFVRVDIKRF